MLPAHLRLAELYRLHKAGKLTEAYGPELLQCLAINERYCWDTMKLRQLTNVAASTQDTEWLNSLRIREDALQLTGRAPTL
ncbi:hypothetical protein R70723_06845 [Paenibacillus sp. FSL R7-0273]|uniref:DUF7667 family protein n=1 Tax=Paenibacillus sp. FSL R7-0273 TaxID=1536772 RepID=UPI0004F5AF71|nr:hypothetical protein [Paenibacillus sp. FSL R7-0273]AIQ45640.1 hypothetical protein R70723_06845 [Paenibacillus sp. FSL R7-0273]OMF95163.1 hypothetical protein BK144_06400 [Paenibacillus sp. FSL R7-0273]